MPDQGLLPFMHLAYLVVGGGSLVAVSTVMIWLVLTKPRRGVASSTPLGQEFVWTLVPALVLVGLTVLGEIPHGWVKIAAGPRAAEIESRLAH